MLTSTVSGDERDAKTVGDELIPDRRRDDWLDAEVAHLRERGKTCGLADFVDEIEAVVVPFVLKNS